ncbi:hypothetical protein JX265_003018 [Neoarthrinium moseri]|uniref:UmuC domain-containing protein n=1 Tax=Neoarthrinium moseri TaxID=1658444 RepID=A0A9P9WT30_9PEZI|nr:hypothetical protein JX265_003018 [Neoarthrinium moseri]
MMTASLSTPHRARDHKPYESQDRIILHFDYDCFYASVFENENPSLKSLPVGVKQKSILATCNYVARGKGVKKLMLISEAQKLCPDLVLVNGEDLTKFRDASKKLWGFLRSHSWNKRVERLGLDEVFMDVSDIISYNEQLLNPNSLAESFFQLSDQDPEKGFTFDATSLFGCTYPSQPSIQEETWGSPLYVRLLLSSHLAGYLRHKLEEDFGYTSTCGVSTNKTLAKLAGTKNKPKNQTTLMSLTGEVVQRFMDEHQIRKIPGMGFRTSHLVENHVLSRTSEAIPHDDEHSAKITTREVLEHPSMSSAVLEKVLGGPGTEHGIGLKVWNLLHGIDNAAVKEASDVPSQISIEDTYMSKPINTQAELLRELCSLSASLMRRMHVDLMDEDSTTESPESRKWLAHPKTLRLSTRTRSKLGTESQSRENFSRSSRSQPLPTFVFSLKEGPEMIAERLVNDAILPLFRRLHNERQGWNLALINICVTNMVLTGNEDGIGGGRDISVMFRTQDAKLKEFTVYDNSPQANPYVADASGLECMKQSPQEQSKQDSDIESVGWEEEDGYTHVCPLCGNTIPQFALPAHERFHALGE